MFDFLPKSASKFVTLRYELANIYINAKLHFSESSKYFSKECFNTAENENKTIYFYFEKFLVQ